ncbi:MAG: putative signal transduction protein with EAL and GGDEF domain [Candidatus Aldehydirespiratoraceae bacterium]|jgi:predicted signal transduction protein with EAL and GGDEF domain
MAFVVVYGVATDIVFVPQTLEIRLFNIIYGYSASYLLALTFYGQWGAAFAVFGTIARFGGDEFVVVGTEGADLSRLLDVTFRLPAELGGVEVEHRISVGCSSLPVVQASAPVLFREAAAALRQAKRPGKHRAVRMADEERSSADERTRLGSRIASALEKREIVAWGQPIVELRTGQMAGIELLARWPQPDGSMVMPKDFVPIIEEQRRGPQLGTAMIANGIDFLAALGDQGRGSIWVGVNLSARHLFHQRLPHEIRELLEQAEVAPGPTRPQDHRIPASAFVAGLEADRRAARLDAVQSSSG